MITDELLKYIQEERKAGKDDVAIRSSLVSNSWTEEDINEAFFTLQPGHELSNHIVISPLGYLGGIIKYTFLFLLFSGIFWVIISFIFDSLILSNPNFRWIVLIIVAILSLLSLFYFSFRKKILKKEKISIKDVFNTKNLIISIGSGLLLFFLWLIIPAIIFALFLIMCAKGGGC